MLTGGGRLCLPRCTPEEPDCPPGFECGGVETTYCAPIDGLCCIDGDDDTYGLGVACAGPDCDDEDAAVHPGRGELCNGVDDDCDPGTADGVGDPKLGDACDGPDTDRCDEGILDCTGGVLVCSDDTDDEIDVCDGVDNDCNPGTLDGSGEAIVGTACDSPGDPDLCLDDRNICDSVAGEVICNDEPTLSMDLCDGVDNDCDAATADGSGDPAVGVPCDGPDADLCSEGTSYCDGGIIRCDDATGDAVDVCDGLDNDCDPGTLDGSGDPRVGATCDGLDSDACEEGLNVCNSGVILCTDATGDNLDVCNGLDEDCDPMTPDGAHDAAVGVLCDGLDFDLCTEGITFCNAGGAVACDDFTPDDFDLCNGIDDDCNPATPDGADDAAVGAPCDGDDTDLCNDGATQCNPAGFVECVDDSGDDLDICNGIDDDCNPATDDGADDVTVGIACDGDDSDLCEEGTTFCNPAGLVRCTDRTPDDIELCDGIDNDCDPTTADGSADTAVGVSCDGPDSDLCEEGTSFCGASGTVECDDASADDLELCDGVDNDCDPATADGADDPAVGVTCDGPDSDLCAEGATICNAAGAVVCDDATAGNVELCNGVDDDCNPATADGAGDPAVGVACDGADGDLCPEGTTFCSGAGAVACGDTTGTNPELCNGVDDDCNPATADGSGDPGVGVACDGPDSDLCTEGTVFCGGGTLQCNDTTGNDIEVCDGVDNDCNPSTVDGSSDPLDGALCDGPDSDLCQEGTFSCSGGGLICSDATSGTPDICNGADDDCDGSVDEVPAGTTCPTQNPSAAHVGSWICSDQCLVSVCDAGYANFDTLAANGCECGPLDNYASTCGSAGAAPVALGATVNMIGYVEAAGDADYLRFNFTARPVGSAWNPRIELLNDAGGQYSMDVLTTGCGIATCGSGNGSKVTTWQQAYTYPGSTPSDLTPKVTSVIVKVYRTFGDAPTCTTYHVRATNP